MPKTKRRHSKKKRPTERPHCSRASSSVAIDASQPIVSGIPRYDRFPYILPVHLCQTPPTIIFQQRRMESNATDVRPQFAQRSGVTETSPTESGENALDGDINEDHALVNALYYNDIDTLKTLLESSKIDLDRPVLVTVIHTRRTLLHMAAIDRNTAIMCMLLDRGASVDVKDAVGMTPLHCAAGLVSSIDAVKLLVERGADPNAVTKESTTVLMFASTVDNPMLVDYLIRRGCTIKATNKETASAIHLAALNGCCGNISVLINHGANVNQRCANGYTPLYLATVMGHDNAMSLLVCRGANVHNRRTTAGNTLLHAAVRSMDKAPGAAGRIAFLLERGARFASWSRNDLIESCAGAIFFGEIIVVKILLDHGCNPNGRSRVLDGERLIVFALKKCRADIAQLLVTYGARVDGLQLRRPAQYVTSQAIADQSTNNAIICSVILFVVLILVLGFVVQMFG